MKQWLRKYRVTILLPEPVLDRYYYEVDDNLDISKNQVRSVTWDTEVITIEDPLRCSFNVRKTALLESNEGVITLWNLSPETESRIISEGTDVILEAGYEENMSIIFMGKIIQPIRGKENGTDYYLKLICLDGDGYLNLAFSSTTLEKNQTRREIAKQIMRASTHSDNQVLVESLENIPGTSVVDGSFTTLERPKVVFGKTSEIINELARMGNATSYIDNGELKFLTQDDEPDLDTAWEINEKTGMIGDPKQSSYQVNVKTLLNPQVKIGDYIHLNNQSIIAEELPIVGEVPYKLESDGHYQIIEIVYSGDNRSQEWYSTIKARTKNGKIPSELKDSKGNLIV